MYWALFYEHQVFTLGRVLFLRFYGPRRGRGPKKRKKRTRPIPSHLDRTSLVNKRFIIWHKEHWKNWSSYLFVFEHWKRNHLDAKVMARAPISWLDKCRKYNHLIGYISNSNFKILKFKTNFCVCRFLSQNLLLKLININFLFSLFSFSLTLFLVP